MDKIDANWLNNNLPATCKRYTHKDTDGQIMSVWRKIDGVWTDCTERELAIQQAKRTLDKMIKERAKFESKSVVDEMSETIDDFIINSREHLYD